MAEYYVGEIRIFGGPTVPQDWHLCDGSLLSISQYQTLYSLIGITYGGDGRTTFGIPNLTGITTATIGNVAIGQGQGTGLTNRVLGQAGGEIQVTLTSTTMPAHTHTLNATTANATTKTPSSSVMLGAATTPEDTLYMNPNASSPTLWKPLNAGAVTNAGGDQPHSNLMPSLAVSYIIAVNGLYPTFPN